MTTPNYEPHDLLPPDTSERDARLASEIENRAHQIEKQLKTAEGVAKLSWDYEPPELNEIIALLANGNGIRAMRLLEKMAYRIAEEELS